MDNSGVLVTYLQRGHEPDPLGYKSFAAIFETEKEARDFLNDEARKATQFGLMQVRVTPLADLIKGKA